MSGYCTVCPCSQRNCRPCGFGRIADAVAGSHEQILHRGKVPSKQDHVPASAIDVTQLIGSAVTKKPSDASESKLWHQYYTWFQFELSLWPQLRTILLGVAILRDVEGGRSFLTCSVFPVPCLPSTRVFCDSLM
ncbi:uncharacterized protein LOC110306475 [Mus caroli]|uniref:Uncharacterized protein LOC110306475 n=1 Tax=Mus caroli TaxID=10089 RepID=A0A6P5QSN8_MUSCR|nr:uncharacterized protein LOC110306475 [Mus caroli]